MSAVKAYTGQHPHTLLMLTLVPLISTLTGPDGLVVAGAGAAAAAAGPAADGLELMVSVMAAAAGLGAGGAGPAGLGEGGAGDAGLGAGGAAAGAAGFGAGAPTCRGQASMVITKNSQSLLSVKQVTECACMLGWKIESREGLCVLELHLAMLISVYAGCCQLWTRAVQGQAGTLLHSIASPSQPVSDYAVAILSG